MGDPRDHWEGVYTTRAETAVSWYQRHSKRSSALVTKNSTAASAVIDVGGGASTLVDDLLARGYTDVIVLDIADAPLAKARARLGVLASRVTWTVADVTRWQPPRRYAVWHDRAVFHFLTTAEGQEDYIRTLRAATEPGSRAILATFAPDGPEKCSGLPVQRYSPESLAARLGAPFELTEAEHETHVTPWGTEQRFVYSVFRRR